MALDIAVPGCGCRECSGLRSRRREPIDPENPFERLYQELRREKLLHGLPPFEELREFKGLGVK